LQKDEQRAKQKAWPKAWQKAKQKVEQKAKQKYGWNWLKACLQTGWMLRLYPSTRTCHWKK
jgi:hypothetical protein